MRFVHDNIEMSLQIAGGLYLKAFMMFFHLIATYIQLTRA